MSVYVVDASVAAKWFFDEPFSDEATRLLDASRTFHVPDFFPFEIDSVLCMKLRRGEISGGEAREIRSAVGVFPLQKHPHQLLMDPAFELAAQTRGSPHDCLYLVLAMVFGSRMVTADRRFHDNICRSKLTAENLCWVENLPQIGGKT